MTTETALEPTTDEEKDRRRKLALLRAVGLDRVSEEQREIALAIAERYDLDLMLRHVVLVDGKPYVTRDGLLWVAHRSGQLDGIEVTEPTVVDGFWRCTATVYRKDMTRPFTYPGRYPTTGGNQKFAPEMAIKVAEVMALRRAFNVAAPVIEERWDMDVPATPPTPVPTLAERASQRRAEIETPPADPLTGEVITRTVEPGSGSQVDGPKESQPPRGDAAAPSAFCAAKPSPGPLGLSLPCLQPAGHTGPHRSDDGSWPR